MPKGDFLLHLGPERHEQLRKAAEAEGVSMAQYLQETLDMRIAAGQPGSEPLTAALRMVERTARGLAQGLLPAPPPALQAPSSPDSWEALMEAP
jgi:HicB-like protein involved in pilus formation